MYRTAIAVVDATRGRLFTLDRVTDERGTHENLVERCDLVNPERHVRAHHIATLDIDFARTVLAALREVLDEHPTTHVILCAGPRMLGNLRSCVPGILPDGLEITEVPRDLAKLSPAELRTSLASHHVLPTEPAAVGG